MNDLRNLEVLLLKFKKFTETMNRKESEYEIFLDRYLHYKQIMQPIRNQHYISCIWSNDELCEQVKPTDFCSCYYIEKFPRKLCVDIVEAIGLDYMLHF